MTKRKDPATKASPGPKKATPPGATRRSVLCTGAEYDAIMCYLWGTLRGRTQPPRKSEPPTKQGVS